MDPNAQHMAVLVEAYDLYLRRNAERGGRWQQFGAGDALENLAERVHRLQRVVDRMMEEGVEMSDLAIDDSDIDDALDIINFASFFVQHVREGRVF